MDQHRRVGAPQIARPKVVRVERDLPLQFTSMHEVKTAYFYVDLLLPPLTPHPGGSDIYASALIYLSILVVYDTGR